MNGIRSHASGAQQGEKCSSDAEQGA